MKKTYYSESDLAEILSVSRPKIKSLIATGRLLYSRAVGRKKWFPVAWNKHRLKRLKDAIRRRRKK